MWVALLLVAAPEPLVEVTSRIPDAVVELKYATPDNFMKKQVYPSTARCLLVRSTLERLERVAKALRAKGFRLKLYDCYRPRHVQEELWKVMPVPGYVANPKTGSHHNRGAAVDLTLADADGRAVEMTSPYDFFGPEAHHRFLGGTAKARSNREALRSAMDAAGFKRNPKEWWHYELPDAVKYPLRDEPF